MIQDYHHPESNALPEQSSSTPGAQGNLNQMSLSALERIGRAISNENYPARIYQMLYQQVVQLLGSDIGFIIAEYKPVTNLISFPYVYNNGQMLTFESMQLGNGVISTLIKERKPKIIQNNIEPAAWNEKSTGRPPKSWLGVPLIAVGEIVGAMILFDDEKDSLFNENDLLFFSALGTTVAGAINAAEVLRKSLLTEQAHKREERMLDALFNNVPEMIFFKDEQERYIRVNNNMASEYHIAHPIEMIGKTDRQLLGETRGAEIEKEDLDLLESGQAKVGYVDKQNKEDGTANWYVKSKVPLYDQNGQAIGLLGISTNITDTKNAEGLIERRNQQLRTAAEIAKDASAATHIEELLTKTVELIQRNFGFYHVAVYLLDPLGEYALLRQAIGPAAEELKRVGFKVAIGSQSVVGRAATMPQPLEIKDVTQVPYYFPEPLLQNTKSELAIPLKTGLDIIGVLDVQSEQANAFSDEETTALQLLADQLSIAIINSNLSSMAEEHLAKHRLLYQITIAASAASNANEAIQTTVKSLNTTLPGEEISVFLPDGNGNLVVSTFAGFGDLDPENFSIRQGDGVIGGVAADHKPIRIFNALADPRFTAIDPKVRSEIAVPIMAAGKFFGVLNIESTQVGAYDENDQEIFATLGNSLGSLINNFQLLTRINEQTQRQRQLYEVTDKIRRSVDMDSILEISAAEICKVLNAHRATININPNLKPEIEAQITKVDKAQ
jgi:PAS domain S-box-containing protein